LRLQIGAFEEVQRAGSARFDLVPNLGRFHVRPIRPSGHLSCH
jgi:hypothetical protein